MKLLDRKFAYIPACSIGGIPDTAKKGKIINGFKPNWWEKDEGFFYWPYILQSAHYVNPGKSWRETLNIGDDIVVFGDSGGFQAINFGFDFDPISVLRWQERECNIGMILDKPPVEMDGSWTSVGGVTNKQFELALEATRKNVEMIIDKRAKDTKYDLKLYNVLQGTTPAEIERWYDVMSQYPLDGWSIGVKPPKPMMVAFCLGFLIEKGITENVHLLGLSGLSSEATAVYGTKYISPMVVDSSSYNRGCTAREYALPLNMKEKIWLGDKGENNTDMNTLDQWPCMCPVCINIPDPQEMGQYTSTVIGVLLSLHNLWWYVQMMQQLTSLVGTNMFDEFVRKSCTPETRKAMDFIDHSAEHGWHSAVQKYMDRGAGNLDEFF